MKKDAYYFSHDSNAHKDPKILKLRAKFGWEGYGVFWAIIETLREQDNYGWKFEEKELLSFSFANGEPIVNQVIDYCIEIGLLIVSDDNLIQSESLNKRMKIREEKRQRRVEAGKKGAQSRWKDGNANGNANGEPMAKDGKGKESKGKESKEKEKILSEIKDLQSQFSSEVQGLLKQYWSVIKKTRKTGTISNSVILKTMKNWKKYDDIVIQYALKTHIDSYDDGKRDEKYTLGIMRGTSKEEAQDRLNKVTRLTKRRYEPDRKSRINYEHLEYMERLMREADARHSG